MQGYGITSYGEDIAPIEVPQRPLGPRDVRVEVMAASLNHLDARVASGSFKRLFPLPTPLALGCDVAGIVVEVGAAVTEVSVGDEVFAMVDLPHIGTFAESVVVPAKDLAHKPAELSFEQAASLPLVALTAWQAIVERGRVSEGDRVLVHGGSGGVGAIAVQLAAQRGAYVVATASGKNADAVRALGAHEVIDHRTQNFAEIAREMDLVLDTQGGQTLTDSIGVLRRGGMLISVAGAPDPHFAAQLGLGAVPRALVRAMSARIRRAAKRRDVTYSFLFVTPNAGQLTQIATMAVAGTLRTQVGEVMPFARVPEAMTALREGRVRGKIVVSRSV